MLGEVLLDHDIERAGDHGEAVAAGAKGKERVVSVVDRPELSDLLDDLTPGGAGVDPALDIERDPLRVVDFAGEERTEAGGADLRGRR